MKQVLQSMRDGQTRLEDVPAPGLGANGVLIQTRASLISAAPADARRDSPGLAAGQGRSQPDKVRQVLDKIKADGLLPTLEAVFNKLDSPAWATATPECLEVGPGVTAFKPGDRVASNAHAELAAVPANLCGRSRRRQRTRRLHRAVAIGLQGVRLLEPTLGETFVVYGLGLIGLVSVSCSR